MNRRSFIQSVALFVCWFLGIDFPVKPKPKHIKKSFKYLSVPLVRRIYPQL